MPDDVKMKRTMDVEGGEEGFFCDSVTMTHNNALFILDLRQNLPIFVPEHKTVTVKQRHKTILMSPAMAKELRRIIDIQLAEFEKKKGKIKADAAKELPKKQEKKEDHHYG